MHLFRINFIRKNQRNSSRMNNKANNNPKTTQFRIHYKKLFKTVEQIAKEASDNVLTLQALPSTPYDFGLGKGAAKPMLCEIFEHECGY